MTSTPQQPLSAEVTLEALRHHMPVRPACADLRQGRVGLVIIDVVVGFTTRGALSDPDSMTPMVEAIDALCRDLMARLGDRLSIFVFRDHHGPDQLEPPYPPHCQEGTGEEELDERLRWLESRPEVMLFDKDCINGLVGALEPVSGGSDDAPHYRNHFTEWVAREQLDQLLVVGDCTDICDLDFVVAVLSARNHGLLGESRRELPVQVYEPACATYHLPDPESLGLPVTARHDRPLTHHAALYFMQSRGAIVCDRYEA